MDKTSIRTPQLLRIARFEYTVGVGVPGSPGCFGVDHFFIAHVDLSSGSSEGGSGGCNFRSAGVES